MLSHNQKELKILVRPLLEEDLTLADCLTRVAFGTHAGIPAPETFWGDADYVRGRWQSEGTASFVAEIRREIVGSIIVTRWGSFGFFGPLGIRPDFWGQGIGKKLVAQAMDTMATWNVRMAGLFTIPSSPKHISLYQHFGFAPNYLTAVMEKSPSADIDPTLHSETIRYAMLSANEKRDCLENCRRLTDSVFEGLDVTTEIEAIDKNDFGETLLVMEGSQLIGFAACHVGPGTEAGSNTCYVKFAVARNRNRGPHPFETLLTVCERYAFERGVARLTAGVNTSRRQAYTVMLRKGFRIDLLGVAMLKPDEAGLNRPDVFVIDDWR